MKRIIYTMSLSICLIGFMSFTNSQKNDPVNDIVDAMAKHNVYEPGKLGYTGLKSKQFDRYLQLCELATDEQIIQLLEHKNVVVRIYAFQAATERKLTIPQEIISKFRRDNNTVRIISGCEASIASVQKLTVGESDVKKNGSTTIRITGAPGEQ